MRKMTLAHNALFTFMSEAVPILLGVLTIPAIIHGLGPARFGILSIIWVLMWYFGIFDLGLGRATTKFVSEACGSGRLTEVPELVWTAVTTQIAVSFFGMAALFTLTPVMVDEILKVPHNMASEVTLTMRMILPMVPLVMITTTLKGVLEGAQRFDLVAIVKTPANLSTYLLTLAGVYLGLQLPGIVVLLLASRLLTMVVYAYFIIRIFSEISLQFAFSSATARSFFRFGGWTTVSSTAGPIFGYLERFLITYWLSVEALSYYAAPADMIARLILIPMSMATVLFPAFSSTGTSDRSALSEMFFRPLKYLLLSMTPVAAILITFARPILHLWLGVDFANRSTLPFQILVASIFLNSFTLIPYTTVQGLGRPELKAKLDILALPVYAALNIWLIPVLGITGAAMAKLLISVVDLLALFTLAGRIMGMSMREMVPGKLAGGIGISTLFLLCVLFIASFPLPLYKDMVLIGLTAVAFVAVFMRLVMDETDRSALRSLLGAFGRRPLAVEGDR